MLTTKRNERIEFNPQLHLLGYVIKRNVKDPALRGAIRQWASTN
jgi:hypothetical protein